MCGSSSVGPADGLHDSLATLGAIIHVDGVDCRPGHPQVLAALGPHWLIGVPGNPYAALVAAFTLLQPLLAGLAGRPLPTLSRATLAGDLQPDGRRTRVPVRWEGDAANIINGGHPGHLGAAAHADALAVVPPAWQADQAVELLQLSH